MEGPEPLEEPAPERRRPPMNPSVPDFPDFSDDAKDRFLHISSMSDEELGRLLDGSTSPATGGTSFEDLEPGSKVRGTVLEVQRDEILIELDRKTLGVIVRTEFAEGASPAPGASIQAEFVRYDPKKEICILTVGGVRTDVAWEDLRPGHQVEGRVVEAVKGGLVLDTHGLRAFMPISQVALERVEDLAPFVGQKFTCEVQEVDRASRKVVVSRRVILERERASARKTTLASLQKGAVLSGKVVRITEHGAFVSLGAVDGLIHASQLRQGAGGKSPLAVGQTVEVEVTMVDADRARVGLDLRRAAGEGWESTSVNYRVGDEVTGWVSRMGPEGAILALEEGLEAVIPLDAAAGHPSELRQGAIVKAVITVVDTLRRRITARLRSD